MATEQKEAPAAATSEAAAPTNPFAALGGSGANAFGTGGGFTFGIPTPAFAPAKPAADEEGGEEGEEGGAAEEECQAEFKPLVQLDEVETSTGEEEEDLLFECKTKLYRFDQDSGEWKERGIGMAKLLQHKENKKVRMLMRQEKTLKIRANHLVMPGTKLQAHAGSDKAWVWSTVDFSEGEQKVELFCLKFGSVEKAQGFSDNFEGAMVINAKLLGTTEGAAPAEPSAEAKAADELAEGVEKVVVA